MTTKILSITCKYEIWQTLLKEKHSSWPWSLPESISWHFFLFIIIIIIFIPSVLYCVCSPLQLPLLSRFKFKLKLKNNKKKVSVNKRNILPISIWKNVSTHSFDQLNETAGWWLSKSWFNFIYRVHRIALILGSSFLKDDTLLPTIGYYTTLSSRL